FLCFQRIPAKVPAEILGMEVKLSRPETITDVAKAELLVF
ncbi:hypothetical protein DBR06_SOUSAS10810009, partial [Sousa chinensis]